MGTKRRKILVVDESITFQKMVNITFSSPSDEVVTASDVHDALLKLKSLRPDVLLMDAHIGQGRAEEVLRQVVQDKDHKPAKIVVIHTDKNAQFENCIVLQKPVDAKKLIEALQEIPENKAQTDRLQAAASEVITHNEVNFTEPAPTHVAPTQTVVAPHVSEDVLRKLVQDQLSSWVKDELPKMAERLLKEELERQLKSR